LCVHVLSDACLALEQANAEGVSGSFSAAS
jgi:hypothetical protein